MTNKHTPKPNPEVDALRARISELSTAILRISASLDLETVLQEVVESARTLTGASYSAIVPIDESGRAFDFFTSGLTEEEHRQLADWPDGLRLFEHFRDFSGVHELQELPEYVRSLGFSSGRLPPGTLRWQGTSMIHRDQHVGNFYLVQKEGSEAFTSEDEDVLALFASQAATAIVNARTHQAEQRARTDLEALVETSPVGVAVFDARTGYPKLLNREARRIVESLREPDRPVETLLEVLNCRLSDGREIALDQLPLSKELGHAETLRAEEVVLSVPDGRSVTTLINATPIRSEHGEVLSMVVTIQDLDPLRDMERMRSEFLSMVSHELRAPLTSIRGSASTLLDASPGLDPAEMREFYRIILEQANHMRVLISDLLDAGRIDSGTLSVEPEPSDVAALVDRARSTFQSGGSRHPVLIDLPPNLPRVMADRQRIEQVLNNLLTNAARNALESFPIRISATREGVYVAISIQDEGKGVASDQLPHLFQKYTVFKGSDGVSGVVGSGLGLAICKGLVEAHGGRIWAESPGIGQGTCLSFTLPVAEEPGVAVPDPSTTDRQGAGGTRKPIRVLVVDDDPQTLRYVRDALETADYSVRVTGDHGELSHIIQVERPELVLLDLMLPGTDGIELLESVPELSYLPVIFISAYGRDEIIAQALEAGAADYITKPFSTTELVARIRAALRSRTDPDPFVLGELAIDFDQRRVSVAGDRVDLTVTEYKLLCELSLNAGRVLTFERLMRQVWGTRGYTNPKLVRAFIKQLRAKLGDDASKPAYIFNERGVGYRMARPE